MSSMPNFAERLKRIRQSPDFAHISDITRGLEKESLRVTPKGLLANTPHPQALGSALTHPQITTDYSEALLEFITPPSKDISTLITTLDDLHRLTYEHIGTESLWVNSMPCMIASDEEIPIARYGSSNSGRMKSIYREGLGHRYGRAMQTIAGIHFNYSLADEFWQTLREQDASGLSLQEYKTQGYFRLIRNFRRNFWLLMYLFGAAPAVCRSFVNNRQHQLVAVGDDEFSLHTPFATSLRMGDLGYQSSAQQSLVITYNCLQSYSDSLCQAITQSHPEYQAIGIKDANDQYRQLNTSLLQIENEFYSVIRPKRTATSGQTALNALNMGGVEYIEVRCLDLDPFEEVGISAQTIRFLDVFLVYCLLEDSPESDINEYQQQQENQYRMVYRGRDPELTLLHFGKEQPARNWGHKIFKQLELIADLLDQAQGDTTYTETLKEEAKKLDNDKLTPSAKILKQMQEQQVTFYRWAMNRSLNNRDYFITRPLERSKKHYYQQMAAQSLLEQQQMEKHSNLSFEEFLAEYYAQYQCHTCDSRFALAD